MEIYDLYMISLGENDSILENQELKKISAKHDDSPILIKTKDNKYILWASENNGTWRKIELLAKEGNYFEGLFNIYKKQERKLIKRNNIMLTHEMFAILNKHHVANRAYPTHRIQDQLIPSTILLPEDLVKQGGYTPVDSFLGAYTQLDLVKYFSSLRAVADEYALHKPIEMPLPPIVLNLLNVNHAIVVAYDTQTKEFYFCDANYGSWIEAASDPVEIACWVKQSFTKYPFIYSIFETNHYGTKQDISVLNSINAAWHQHADFVSIHTITSQKAIAHESSNSNYLKDRI